MSQNRWPPSQPLPSSNFEFDDSSTASKFTYSQAEPSQRDLPSSWPIFEQHYTDSTFGDNLNQLQTQIHTNTLVNEQGYQNPESHPIPINVAQPDLQSQVASSSYDRDSYSYGASSNMVHPQNPGSTLAGHMDLSQPYNPNAQPTLELREGYAYQYPYNVPGPTSYGSGPYSRSQPSTMASGSQSFHRQDLSHDTVAQQHNAMEYSQELPPIPGAPTLQHPKIPICHTPHIATLETRLHTLRPADASQASGARLRQVAPTGSECEPNLNFESMSTFDGMRLVGPSRSIGKYKKSAKRTKFLGSRIIPTSSVPPLSTSMAGPSQIVFVPSASVDDIKKDAWERLMRSLFKESLFPTPVALNTMAQTALDGAVAAVANDDLDRWKSRQEGQSELRRLKGAFKTIHDGFEDINQVFVTGVYQISFGDSADKNAELSSRTTRATFLLADFAYLDGFVELLIGNGQFQTFRIPFGNHAVMMFLEYFLLQRQLTRYVAFNEDGWEVRLSNTIALAATFCKWGLTRCCTSGWFVDAEFDTPDNRQCYDAMKSRMRSLVGIEKMLFDQ